MTRGAADPAPRVDSFLGTFSSAAADRATGERVQQEVDRPFELLDRRLLNLGDPDLTVQPGVDVRVGSAIAVNVSMIFILK